MKNIFKKLLRKLRWKLYRYHMKRARKIFYKIIGAKKYLPDKKEMKLLQNAFYGKSCYADSDSLKVTKDVVGSYDFSSSYPSVMKTFKFSIK